MPDQSAAREPWARVLGLSVDQLVAWGVLYYSYSVLSVPIARDLAVPTSTVAAGFSGALLISALLARRVGRSLDRRGARPVLVRGAIVGTITFGGLSVVEHTLPLLLLFVGLGAAQALSLYEPAFRAIVAWFPAAQGRSRALLVLTAIAGLASTVFLPLTAALLDRFGWRPTVAILATLTAAVTLPFRLALPRPEWRDPADAPSSPPIVDRSRSTTRLLNGGLSLQAFAATGATLCLVWHLVERGQTLAAAASLAGLVGASQVPGRLLLSPLSHVCPIDVRLPLLLVVQGVALMAITVLSGPALVVGLVAFGAAAGVMTLERATVVVEWFGRESFGTASGQLASGTLLARAGAPLAVELMHDGTSYAAVLGVLALCLLTGSALVVLALRKRRRLPGATTSRILEVMSSEIGRHR